MPAVLNAANEVAVEAFLRGRLGFRQMARLIGEIMDHHQAAPVRSLDEVLRAHAWAAQEAQDRIARGYL
jgi:1-deoxy-D-xylulose-5-phosphate reductoisomerase